MFILNRRHFLTELSKEDFSNFILRTDERKVRKSKKRKEKKNTKENGFVITF